MKQWIGALPYAFFCYDVRSLKIALIAQLDRVQVSEACGVGSSPAERTIFLFQLVSKEPLYFRSIWTFFS